MDGMLGAFPCGIDDNGRSRQVGYFKLPTRETIIYQFNIVNWRRLPTGIVDAEDQEQYKSD